MTKKIFHTDFIAPTQSTLTGVASVLDVFIAETPYNYSSSPEEADCKAIAHDWAMVGQDLFCTIESHQDKK